MPYRLLILCLLLFSPLLGVAQRDEREASATTGQPGDTNRVNSLVQETYVMREKNPVRAIEYCLTAIRLAKQLEYRRGEGRALGSLGWIYYRKGDFIRALEISYEALNISEQMNDQAETARCLNNLGAVYYEEGEYERALRDVTRGLSIAMHMGDDKTVVRSLNNIANLYQAPPQNLDSSQTYATRALLLSEKIGDDYYGSVANHTLGDLYVKKGAFKEALKKYNRSLELSSQVSDVLKMDIWRGVAGVYIHEQRRPEAIAILKRNIELGKKYGYREELTKSYQLMAEVYKQEGNFSLALDYMQRYTLLNDSIYNEQKRSRLATLQSQSDLAIQQTQIELLTKDTLLNKKEISRQRIELYSTIGGLVGILLLASILYYGNRKINRTNVLLEQRTQQLASLNATKDKLFSIISHDLRSPLNSLKGMLGLVENRNLTREEFAVLAEKLKKNFNAVSNDLENLLHWSMAQLQGIQTNSARINVQPIVQEHVTVFQEIAKAKDIQLENKISENLFALADEGHIRLVLRNLINNAIKFTPPGGIVKISSHLENPFIKILVADTGVGIGSEQLESLFRKDKSVSTKGTNQEKGVGLGLLLCQEFVENNGGQLNVASELGKGSVFSFTLRAA